MANKILNIRAIPVQGNSSVAILISKNASAGRIAVVQNIAFETIKEGTAVGPSLTIQREAAQILMDDLWYAGLRPVGTGN